MNPNLDVYQIATRYALSFLVSGIGAFITNYDGFLYILGYVLIAVGMALILSAILGMAPFKGSNEKAIEAAANDFKDDEWDEESHGSHH